MRQGIGRSALSTCCASLGDRRETVWWRSRRRRQLALSFNLRIHAYEEPASCGPPPELPAGVGLGGHAALAGTASARPIPRSQAPDEFEPHSARILLVDDDPSVRFVLRKTLELDGYEVAEADSVQAARAILHDHPHDLVMLDKNLPGESGLVLLGELSPWSPRVAVVLMTAQSDVDSAVEAMLAGAYDYLRKPFGGDAMVAAVERALHRRHLELQNQKQRTQLEGLVKERTSDVHRLTTRLMGTQAAVLRVACSVAESRDPETGAHLDRMAAFCRELALALPSTVRGLHGVDQDFADRIAESAPLHDIGKVGIPDDILLKPGKLTRDEFDVMKTHPILGHQILESVRSRMTSEDAQLLDVGSDICLAHHERFDGGGYPTGLEGEEIPIAARIAALADFYDAVTSARPYRRVSFEHREARAMILDECGCAFDPDVVMAFTTAEQKIVTMRQEMIDMPA